MQHNSYRRWITLAIISFSGGVSFDLAYLRYIYQIPMAKFMGFSNTEIALVLRLLFFMPPAALLPINFHTAK